MQTRPTLVRGQAEEINDRLGFFYKPEHGVVGDCIPYYFEGRYHVFYLRDDRDVDSFGVGKAWHHVSTTDFAHFEEHGEALASEPADQQGFTAATGCVYTDESGKHHIFYTGFNPHFRNDLQHEQALLHATSDDLMSWTKIRKHVWYADESMYERHDWRDPFVFRHEETGRYNMLVAARTREGASSRRGCTGLLTSDDLVEWRTEKPFYAPGRYHGHECPDLFRIGDWYYLVFSEYTTHTVTRYFMSRSPDGPWATPDHNQFDSRAFYAGKTAGDGNRRFVFGWNPTKSGNVDEGEWEWGGCLTVHEVLQNDDGTLCVRMPSEPRRAFAVAQPVQLDLDDACWSGSAGTYRVDSPFAYSGALSQPMPETYLLEGALTFERASGEAGLLVGVSQDGETGYFLKFNRADQALQFGKIGGYRPLYLDHMPELDRPLEIFAGMPSHFRVIVDKTALVAYIDDRIALSARMYGRPLGRAGLFADGAAVSVDGFTFSCIACR
jgi:beta-fructofuranosidase